MRVSASRSNRREAKRNFRWGFSFSGFFSYLFFLPLRLALAAASGDRMRHRLGKIIRGETDAQVARAQAHDQNGRRSKRLCVDFFNTSSRLV